MKAGPLLNQILIFFIVITGVISIQSNSNSYAQTTSGILNVRNNSTTQDYTQEGVTVRTQAYICVAGSPVAQGVVLPNQVYNAVVPQANYQIRTYNEVIPLGQGELVTFMSGDSYFHQLVCSGVIPTSLVATITDISPTQENVVTLTGTTEAIVSGSLITGREVPIIQAIPPSGRLSTGVIVEKIDLRDKNIGELNTKVALGRVCIDNTSINSSPTVVGEYPLIAGVYRIREAVGGVEVAVCREPEVQVTLTDGQVSSVLFATIDEQNGFGGVVTTVQMVSTLQNNPPLQSPNSSPQPPQNQTQLPQNQHNSTSNSSNNPTGLIRSGGNEIYSYVIPFFAVLIIGIVESLLTLFRHYSNE